MDEENHPLLVHAGEDELWDAVEEGVPGADRTFTVKRLLEEHPTEVLRTLQKRSVRRVAEFLVEVGSGTLDPRAWPAQGTGIRTAPASMDQCQNAVRTWLDTHASISTPSLPPWRRTTSSWGGWGTTPS